MSRPTKRERFYESLKPIIKDAAWNCGYAVGFHGSLKRDMDVMAMPWIEHASSPEDLRDAIAGATGGHAYARWTPKPHGRLACSIIFQTHVDYKHKWPNPWVDLSVMPRQFNPE